MAEPTLNLKVQDIQAKLGTFAGWGRGANFDDPAWTSFQQAMIDDAVQSGLRCFYYPPPLPGEMNCYDWSFLKPTATAVFPVNAQTVLLPDDFGGFDGQVTVLATSSTSMPWRIEWRNEAQIREMYSATPVITGPPMFVAEQPIKGTTGTASQRYQMFLYPAADQTYTLQFQYYLNPDVLSGAFPYAYGGPQHVETILESCLAAMEQRLDDSMTVHTAKFAERLAASISMDRKNKPQKLGKNMDHSDQLDHGRLNTHYWAPAATYNGVPFG